mmetsp:Transcript_36935/g.119121  ORF Transcript_36935/g.119121 Transcript_36935/m.119121 type:complete len:593 (-) Transcript_36935:100-1878(-)
MPAAPMDEAEDCGHLQGYGDPASKTTRLQEIAAQRELDVKEAKVAKPEAEVRREAEQLIADIGAPMSLTECLSAAETSSWRLALAAEFKRASPSKGDINADLDAAQQALEYTKEGASVLSVLTEPKWFKGTLQDLKDVRLKTQAWAKEQGVRRPACLRKDFVIDEYQVLEAVAHGADTVLLMVSILPQSRLRALIAFSREWGLEPLVEVVTVRELKVALDAGAKVLGVNNRNLHTFELDKQTTALIAKALRETFKIAFGPGHSTKILALSGLSTPEDVQECRDISCSGVLVGETLMRAPDPGAAIVELMGSALSGDAGRGTVGALPVAPGAVIVKVCGVVREEDARCAVAAGANMIGVIFAKSKRGVSVEQAKAIVDVVRRFGERKGVVAAGPRGAALATVEGLAQRCAELRIACKRTPLVVGVFMDQALDEVVETSVAVGLDAVQLHGSEDTAFISELRKRLPHAWVLKVVHLPPRGESDAAGLSEELRSSLTARAALCDALLLDTAVKGSVSGGTGATFDWEVARRVQDEWGVPVIVAGGLSDENVAELVGSAQPYGVDVASGVEDAPGVKNAEKTTAYVKGAKRVRVSA